MPELGVRVADQADVAGPADRSDHVVAGQVLDVVVAGEPPELTGVGGLLPSLSIARASPPWSPRPDRRRRPSSSAARCRASRSSTVTLPLYLGSNRSLTESMSGASFVLTIRPGHAALPGNREVALGVERSGCETAAQVVLDVRHVVEVDLLQVAEVVHLLRHPVGDHEDVAPAGLALVEQRLDLAEELDVVVDVLDVVDADAGTCSSNSSIGAVRALVDVAGPVRDVELALDRSRLAATSASASLPPPTSSSPPQAASASVAASASAASTELPSVCACSSRDSSLSCQATCACSSASAALPPP